MGRLSAFPAGLLDLVGAQNFGINPKELGELVSPIIDLTELYLISKLASPTGSLSPAVTGFNQLGPAPADPFLVPQGEVWRVFVFSCSTFTGAGAAATYSPTVQINGNRFQIAPPRTNNVAGVSDWNVMTSAPFWLPAGARLGVEVQQLTATVSLSGQALVSKLKA